MGNRVSKVYTRTGDNGTTGLGDGTRTPKDGARIEAIGAVDETNSVLGMILAETLPQAVRDPLVWFQHKLFDLGGELCLPGQQMIDADDVRAVETALDTFNADLPRLKEFILPGGGRAAAACHLARTTARRAERRCWTLAHVDSVNPSTLAFLNRLSDLLFVLGRVLARFEGGSEVLWHSAYSRAP